MGIKQATTKFECKHQTNNEPSSMDNKPSTNNNNNGSTNNKSISTVVLYIHGLGEKFKKACKTKEYRFFSKAQTLQNTPHGT